jgi:hypothetical protein
MSDRDILLQDITDQEIRAEVEAILDSVNTDGIENIVEDVLNEASGNNIRISKSDRDAIAKEASRRMEIFFKGTILIGYIDIRRQIKSTQREIAALRKDHDGFEKKAATKEDLETLRKNLDARIQSGLKGKPGSNRRQEMDEFYETVDSTAENVKRILDHLGIPRK